MNRTILSGRLTADPVMRTTPDGKTVANFTLAVQRTKTEADFIPCQAWEKTASIFEKYFKKGMMAIVVGRIVVNAYEDKNGDKKFWTFVNVSEVEFGSPKKTEEKEPGYYDGADEEFAPF